MAKAPQIISITPSKYATDVPVNTSIRAEFSIDLDSRYIKDFVFMTTQTGETVEIRTAYRAKVITVTPTAPLSMGTTYQITFVGDSNLDDDKKQGIRSIIGDSLAGSVTSSFSTEKDAALAIPVPVYPIHGSIIQEDPEFEWESVEDAAGYHIEVSKSNVFTSVLYPDELQIIRDTKIKPDVKWEEGNYYWRIRSVRDDGVTGEWSKPMQYNLHTSEEGSIAEEDADDEDFPLYESLDFDIEVVESFPKELESFIKVTAQNLYFRVIGEIDLTLLSSDSITLEGVHISGDGDEISHGLVTGKTTVVKANDGTAYIIFTPDVIPSEEEE